MPKARKRKQEPVRKSTQNTHTSRNNSVKSTTITAGAKSLNRPFLSPGVRGPQSLILPTMIALGCWGMAFSFFVFSTDPNHNLYAGMGVLMALLWTFSVGVRIRKLLAPRQKS